MTRPFRFGVNLFTPLDGPGWTATCRRAEALGYDVLLVPDHLGAPAPFPALAAAAAATERPRIGTFVLNAGFWNAALLAREAATLDQLSGGRLELGLGTGYVRSEFEDAQLPWEGGGARVDRLAALVEGVSARLADPGHLPATVQAPRPPLLLAGNGDRMLRLAAAHADIAAFTGATLVPGSGDGALRLVPAATLDERVAHLREQAGSRAPQIETNLLVQKVEVTGSRRSVLAEGRARPGLDHLSIDELLDAPTLLVGTVEEIAEQLRGQRERFGFSYVSVLQPSMEALGPVIEKLAGS